MNNIFRKYPFTFNPDPFEERPMKRNNLFLALGQQKDLEKERKNVEKNIKK